MSDDESGYQVDDEQVSGIEYIKRILESRLFVRIIEVEQHERDGGVFFPACGGGSCQQAERPGIICKVKYRNYQHAFP